MKLINLSKGISRRTLGSLALIICLASLSGCLNETDVPQTNSDSPVPAAAEPCGEEGDMMWFNIDHGPSADPQDYFGTLTTGPFTTDACLCRVSKYEFILEGYHSISDLHMIDMNRNTVTIDVATDVSGNTVVTVPAPYDLPGAELSVYLDLLHYAAPDNVPSLLKAGGLCIVESIGGTGDDPPVNVFSPIIVHGSDVFGQPTKKAYIPVSITVPL